ncbi:MAG TPA: glycosyltransferase family 4 protein [Stellaceae bacterium]|nr:glycosyltransferase family 4 protein [Stellaceae bacterium]
MRVLIVNLGYPPNTVGGAELLVQSLARGLVARGVETSVLSLSQKDEDWEYDDAGVHAYFVRAHPMGIALLDPGRTLTQKVLWHGLGEMNIWTSRKLRAVLQKERPDIVNTHNLLGLSVSAWRGAAAFGVPVVHTLHDYQLLCPRGTMFRHGAACAGVCRSCRLLTTRRRWASAVPAAVIGVSRFILEAHVAQGYFARARKVVIPNGFQRSQATAAKSSSAGEGPLRVGFIGRLHPIKGVELLFDALRKFPPESYIAKIAGTGSVDDEAWLRRLARGLAVDFMGWVGRDQFYPEIDVLVVPSLYCEPQGMVVIEAASFGVPVVYSKLGGLGEVGAAFPAFRAFDPAQPDGLSAALRSWIEDPSLARHLEPSIGPVPAPFTLDGLVDSYLRTYATAIAAREDGAVGMVASNASGPP